MISKEEKIRRRKNYEKNLNMNLSGFSSSFAKDRLANRPNEEDLIYEKWINGEITFNELKKEINEYIKRI